MEKLNPHNILTARVMHKRLWPRVNQFIYQQYYVVIALSKLTSVGTPLFSLNRFNLFSFHEKDYGPCDGSNLFDWCITTLRDNNVEAKWLQEVFLVTQPRLLGWVFNPVSFWLCLDKDQNLRVVFAETRNTFGERHTYLIHHTHLKPIKTNDRLRGSKRLYVSPFFKVEGEYIFRFTKTAKNFGVWIDYSVDGEQKLLTSLTGHLRKPLCSPALLKMFFKIPLANLKTFFLIHYQAIKLSLKKIRLTHRDPFTGPKASACSKENQTQK